MFPLRDTIPSRHLPVMVWLLVLVNAAVFLLEWQMSEEELVRTLDRYGIVPARLPMAFDALVSEPLAYRSLFSSMFLHGGLLHVLGNLWMLLIFGDNVEDRMGRGRFLAFYLLCGLAAGIVHVYFNRDSTVPTIGASGAIAGVMGAYFVLFPRARVITLIPLLFYPLFVELPAYVFLGVWITAQVLEGTASLVEPQTAGGIAFLAHVGGFAAGVLLHWLFRRRERRA